MMADDCGRSFDESLLTGYLDGMLTQADEQRVRMHVEECGTCRTALDEMLQLREVTTNAEFQVPADDQWSEQARSRASGLSMGLGWTISSSCGSLALSVMPRGSWSGRKSRWSLSFLPSARGQASACCCWGLPWIGSRR